MGKRSCHRTNRRTAALLDEKSLNRCPGVALTEAVEELVQSLIGLLEPNPANILTRAEIYHQSPREIANQLGMQQSAVNAELKKGRQAVLALIA